MKTQPLSPFLFLRRLAPVCVLLALTASAASLAAEATWKAGLASVRITPDKPVLLAGYASRNKPFEKVEQDIFAKALALEDDQNQRALLITTDLLGMGRALSDPVCARIQKQTGLRREQIILSSSHTHAAPELRGEEEAPRPAGDENAKNTAEYTRQLQDRLVELGSRAIQELKPARLSWGSGVAHFAMNRREFTPRGVILGVNPHGLADRSVPVLRVDSPDGSLRGILFGYACHGTTLTQTNYALCGDFAGFAQGYVQEHYPGAQAMFMIGCGGDANPYPRGTMEDARENGRVLAAEVTRVVDGKLSGVNGPINCVITEASLPLRKDDRATLEQMAAKGPSWGAGNAKALLARLDRGLANESVYKAPINLWQFGTNLTLVALSGEVVSDYVPLIEQAIGPLKLWLAAYCNDVFGYVPSARTLREGGYECRGLYTTSGFFAPETQDVIVRAVLELARQAGRPALPMEAR